MTLEAFLAWAITTVGAGVIVWAIINRANAWFGPLSGEFKLWLSIALSFLVPVGGYALSVALGYVPFDNDGLFAALTAAWLVSQGVHRQASANADNAAPPLPAPDTGAPEGQAG